MRARWDGRWDTPLAQQGIVDGTVFADTLGIVNPLIVAPQDPGRSMLLQRVNRLDAFRMPPLASSVLDDDAVVTITAWIGTLTPGTTPPPPGPGPGPAPGPAPAAVDDTPGNQNLAHRCGCSTADTGMTWMTFLAAGLALGLASLRRR